MDAKQGQKLTRDDVVVHAGPRREATVHVSVGRQPEYLPLCLMLLVLLPRRHKALNGRQGEDDHQNDDQDVKTGSCLGDIHHDGATKKRSGESGCGVVDGWKGMGCRLLSFFRNFPFYKIYEKWQWHQEIFFFLLFVASHSLWDPPLRS
jgi:hypothetical protein